MNCIHYRHHARRIAAVLGGLAASALVTLTGATAALAYPVPPQGCGVPEVCLACELQQCTRVGGRA